MWDGADRIDVAYEWPRSLRLPARPPKLVYLDLNHWIALAKVLSGHHEGEANTEVLVACQRAVEKGTALFPISDTIYVEISKIRQYRQRHDLRQVIERVSGYMVVTSRSVVTKHEIEAVLDRIVGPNPQPISTVDYLDWGVARALGMIGGFKVKSINGEDVTAEVRSLHTDGPEAFDRVLAVAELELNRLVIDGPTPAEEPKLRELGWDPTGVFEIAGQRAAQEIDQVRRFDLDPRWRRGRIRDVVTAREVVIEVYDALLKGLADRGVTLEEVFQKPRDFRRAFDSMPSFDVAVTLKTSYHRDPMHQWTSNDIHDVDALGSTLPYCDIVLTDKEVSDHATRTGLAERLNSIVLPRLSDLPEQL